MGDEMTKSHVEKWYLEELKRKAKPTLLQRLGLTRAFFNRKKKDKFSLVAFVRYVVRNWEKTK